MKDILPRLGRVLNVTCFILSTIDSAADIGFCQFIKQMPKVFRNASFSEAYYLPSNFIERARYHSPV